VTPSFSKIISANFTLSSFPLRKSSQCILFKGVTYDKGVTFVSITLAVQTSKKNTLGELKLWKCRFSAVFLPRGELLLSSNHIEWRARICTTQSRMAWYPRGQLYFVKYGHACAIPLGNYEFNTNYNIGLIHHIQNRWHPDVCTCVGVKDG